MENSLAHLTVNATDMELRRATADDVGAIVGLIRDDAIARARDGEEDWDNITLYLEAFAAIDADPAQLLVVVVDEHAVVGTMQLTLIPGLARRGATRANVEQVRVAPTHRNQGLGAAMIKWAIEEARRRGCGVVQLTSDKRRTDAHRFYERLGFAPSHTGFKLKL